MNLETFSSRMTHFNDNIELQSAFCILYLTGCDSTELVKLKCEDIKLKKKESKEHELIFKIKDRKLIIHTKGLVPLIKFILNWKKEIGSGKLYSHSSRWIQQHTQRNLNTSIKNLRKLRNKHLEVVKIEFISSSSF